MEPSKELIEAFEEEFLGEDRKHTLMPINAEYVLSFIAEREALARTEERNLILGKCQECENPVETENIKVGIPLCKKCDEKNWITNPVEIQKEIENDTELSKGLSKPTPYFPNL